MPDNNIFHGIDWQQVGMFDHNCMLKYIDDECSSRTLSTSDAMLTMGI